MRHSGASQGCGSPTSVNDEDAVIIPRRPVRPQALPDERAERKGLEDPNEGAVHGHRILAACFGFESVGCRGWGWG